MVQLVEARSSRTTSFSRKVNQFLHFHGAWMGIRFKCPNGHGLHVKNFLAGKKGICPKCGLRVEIPKPGGVGGVAGVGQPSGTGKVATTASNKSAPSEPSRSVDEAVQPSAVEQPSSVQSAPVQPAPVQPAPNVEGSHPELAAALSGVAESEAAAWYVRVESGEQYGPAKEQLFRSWVEQGRVGAKCLVWREGWENWRDATAVLGAMQAAPPIPPTAPPAPTAQSPTVANNSVTGQSSGQDLISIGNDGVAVSAPSLNIDPVAPPSPDGIQIETNRPIPVSRVRSQFWVLVLFAVCLLLLVPLVFVFLYM